jgi:site-specific recombinase XerD
MAAKDSNESLRRASLYHLTERYLEEFANSSGHTARAKRSDLRRYLEFLRQDCKAKSITEINATHWNFSSVQRFIEYLLSQGESPATVARRLATLKHMGRSFAERVPSFINPAREVRAPRLPTIRPKSLERIEIEKVLETARQRFDGKKSFNRFRNLVMLQLLLDCGLRADEVRLLTRAQLSEELDWLERVRTKGRRYRAVYVSSSLRPLLKEYLEARRTELQRFYSQLPASIDKKLPLFVSGYKAQAGKISSFFMGAKSVWRAINECSVETKLHPHLLRHSYATQLLDYSGDIRLVSQALGHSDVRVTMRYTERSAERLAQTIEAARKDAKRQK